MSKRRSRARSRSAAGTVQTLMARREELRRAQLMGERARAAELERLGLNIDTEAATREGMNAHFQGRFNELKAQDDAEAVRLAHETETRSDPLNLPTSMPRWSWSSRQFNDADLIKRATESDGADLSKAEVRRAEDLLWDAKSASADMVDRIEQAVEKFPDEHIVSPSPIYRGFRAVMDDALDGLERQVEALPGGAERIGPLTSRFLERMEPYAEALTAELEGATQRVSGLVHQSMDDPEGIVIHGPDAEFRRDTARMVLGYLGEAAKDRFVAALDEAALAGDLTEDGMRRRVRGDAMVILQAAFEEATRMRDDAVKEVERLREEIGEFEAAVARTYDPIRDFRRDEAVALRALAVYRAARAAQRDGAV